MADKISSLIKKYSANVTVTANGEINLLNVIPSDRVPVFVQGSTGRLTNGTGANEYAPYIFGDTNAGTTKTITVYTVPRIVCGMSDKISRQVTDFKSMLTIVPQGASLEVAIKEGRFICIRGTTGPIQQANTLTEIVSGVPTSYHPVNDPAIGALSWATDTDAGTGYVSLGYDGKIKVLWSKTTTYGLAYTLCFAV